MASKDPVELAVQTLAEIHAENLRVIPSPQLGIERITNAIGRPWFALAAIALVAAWVLINIFFLHVDRPQFPWLQLVVSLASLLMTTFILITQNRLQYVAERRAEVTLQIALVTEQKVAKIIELLEQLRRDDPHLPNRRDQQAETMAQATDVREAVSELEKAQEQAAARQQQSG